MDVEEKPRWSVTVDVTPMPPDFPVGAYRAATRMCLAETHAAADARFTLEAKLESGKAVTFAGAANDVASCLTRKLPKPKLKDKAPAALTIQITPPS